MEIKLTENSTKNTLTFTDEEIDSKQMIEVVIEINPEDINYGQGLLELTFSREELYRATKAFYEGSLTQ